MQIKMFYLSPKISVNEGVVNEFLKQQGKNAIGVQMVSSPTEGGDTVDTIMVILNN